MLVLHDSLAGSFLLVAVKLVGQGNELKAVKVFHLARDYLAVVEMNFAVDYLHEESSSASSVRRYSM